MRNKVTVGAVLMLALLLGLPSAHAQELANGAEPTVAPDGDAQGLSVLSNWVGEWDVVVRTKDAPTTKGQISAEWILGGRFVKQTVSLSNADGITNREILTLLTYDEGARVFRIWSFDSNFPASQSTGKWDAETRTMATVIHGSEGGVTVTTTANFAREGVEEWAFVGTDQAGHVVWEVTGTNTRRTAKLPPAPPIPGSAVSVEQKALDRFLGTWRTDYTVPRAKWTQVEKSGAANLKYTRILGAQFIEEYGEHVDGKTGLALQTYDTRKRCYRRWWFSSDGQTTEGTGTWDPDTATFTWTDASDARNIAKHRFVDDNTFEWNVEIKDSTAMDLFLMGGKAKRVSGKATGGVDADEPGSDLQALKAAAERGDAQAQCSLGQMYENGCGVRQDYAKAVVWYRKAAERGSAAAQNNLGNAYARGEGVVQDFAAAAGWYRMAAEQGLAEAESSLGFLYALGRGIRQDSAEAVRWVRKAADQGDAKAQYNLGVAYFNGEGVPKDLSEAAKWFQKAAEQGDANAQNDLGAAYFAGEGVPQDYAKAAEWTAKAAEQGFAQAQGNLALMYQKGQGVQQDYAKALAWFSKARESGHPEAQMAIDVLLGEIRHRFAEQTVVTEGQIAKYYKKHAEDYSRPKRILLRQIFLRADESDQDTRERVKARMDTYFAELRNGADFADLAKAHSEAPNAEDGGLVGWIVEGDIVEPLAKVAFGLVVGEHSEVLSTQHGFHILSVDGRAEAGTASLKDVRDEVEMAVRRQKAEEMLQEWLSDIMVGDPVIDEH